MSSDGSALRVVAFVAGSIAGAGLALACLRLLLLIDGDQLLVASIVHTGVVFAAVVMSAAAMGIATASGRSGAAMLHRAAASAGLLALLGAAAFGAFQLSTATSARGFDARSFRSANASGDLETMERQARNAVHDGALIGMSPDRVRRELGEPSRTGQRRYVWDVGTIDDLLGPGDAGALYVEFDRSRRRVVSARVE